MDRDPVGKDSLASAGLRVRVSQSTQKANMDRILHNPPKKKTIVTLSLPVSVWHKEGPDEWSNT